MAWTVFDPILSIRGPEHNRAHGLERHEYSHDAGRGGYVVVTGLVVDGKADLDDLRDHVVHDHEEREAGTEEED